MDIIKTLNCLANYIDYFDSEGKTTNEIFDELKTSKYYLPDSVRNNDKNLMNIICELCGDEG